jgi:hypothetical protein
MKISKYVKSERRIASADGAGIVERWRWGREALADPEVTNPAGTLRRGRGIADRLIHAARAKGLKLDEREIRHRLQAARTYATETELTGPIRAGYATWSALCDAGFPPIADPDPQPALVDVAGQVTPAAAAWQQEGLDGDDGSVFPRQIKVGGVTLDRDACTLGVLSDYLTDRERWTASHARRNAELRDHLAELLEAVNGDQNVTYRTAVHAFSRGAA